ncbi:biotin transporter BioY [Populibacterium corticicola]|uniref:Biotin transporter n=1 Tax=Populibacterium corticicola TaxID=1812826 RepID=A0ABW5XC32_9MICO
MNSTVPTEDAAPVSTVGPRRATASAGRLGQDIALVASFAALIAVCALMPAIMVAGVPTPITLQTFGVMLAGLVLGSRRGALAVLLYLAIGAAGAPVFASGASGLAPFVGPTSGYLIGFPLLAFGVGWGVRAILALGEQGAALKGFRIVVTVSLSLLISLVTVHALGITGMALRVPMALQDAFIADLIFLPGDIIKTTAAVLVASAVLRAFPVLRELR